MTIHPDIVTALTDLHNRYRLCEIVEGLSVVAHRKYNVHINNAKEGDDNALAPAQAYKQTAEFLHGAFLAVEQLTKIDRR